MKRLGFELLPLSVLAIALAMTPPTQAAEIASPMNQPDGIRFGAARTLAEWFAQLAQTEVVEITNIRVEAADGGLTLFLEASGELTAPQTSTSGNAAIAEIPNAILRLPDGEEFFASEPVAGIALVNITNLPDNQVRIAITGAETVPTINLSTSATGLTASIIPGDPTVQIPDDEAIEIFATGEAGSRYFEPNAATATRTDTPLSEIPQSIQVIPRQVLEDQQVVQLGDAIRNASGVVSSARDQRGPRFIIRGFDNGAVLRNGFRLLDAGSGNSGYQDLANIEQIEVLKGPASILSGEIQPGGAINLVTKQPLAEPFYQARLRAGNRAFVEPSIDLSGPLGADGQVLYRLNALYRREDFYRDFAVPTERFFVAPTVSWAMTDRTDFILELEYLDETRAADFGGLPALGDRVADVPRERITGEPGDAAQNQDFGIGYRFEHRFNDQWKIRHRARYSDFAQSFVSNTTALVVNEENGILARAWVRNAQNRERFEMQTNVVGEFETGPVEHTFLAGVDLYRSNLEVFRALDLTPQPLFNIFEPVYGVERPFTSDSDPKASEQIRQNIGFYVQNQAALFESLFLLAGVRYDNVAQDSANFVPGLATISNSQEDSALTPRFGLVYQPIDEVSLYASYSTSFAPNSGITRAGDLLEPERGEQFEIGARAELLDGRLFANLAFFDITKQNVAAPDPENLPGDIFALSIGEQRSRGIELDIAGEILPGWNVVANYALTDAEITQDNNRRDLEGNQLFGVPDSNLNLWTTYTIQDGSLEGLGFGIGANYVSNRFGDNDNTFILEEYFLTNAAIYYRRDNWRATINVRNLFDVDYIDSSEGSRTIENRPGEGLTVIGSLTFEF